MTINSAQRLQREATESQGVNGKAARGTAAPSELPTQVIDPTQRREDVCSHGIATKLKLIIPGPKIWIVLKDSRDSKYQQLTPGTRQSRC